MTRTRRQPTCSLYRPPTPTSTSAWTATSIRPSGLPPSVSALTIWPFFAATSARMAVITTTNCASIQRPSPLCAGWMPIRMKRRSGRSMWCCLTTMAKIAASLRGRGSMRSCTTTWQPDSGWVLRNTMAGRSRVQRMCIFCGHCGLWRRQKSWLWNPQPSVSGLWRCYYRMSWIHTGTARQRRPPATLSVHFRHLRDKYLPSPCRLHTVRIPSMPTPAGSSPSRILVPCPRFLRHRSRRPPSCSTLPAAKPFPSIFRRISPVHVPRPRHLPNPALFKKTLLRLMRTVEPHLRRPSRGTGSRAASASTAFATTPSQTTVSFGIPTTGDVDCVATHGCRAPSGDQAVCTSLAAWTACGRVDLPYVRFPVDRHMCSHVICVCV